MRYLPLAALLLLVACATPQPRHQPGGLERGATLEAVRAHEPPEPVTATPDRLVYHVDRAGIPMTLTHHFDGNGLAVTEYANRADHDDNNRYIEDFERLKARLIERHGLPRSDRMIWRNRSFADDPARYGDAVAAGHLVYYVEWHTTDVKIVMALRGARLQVTHELAYTPIAPQP